MRRTLERLGGLDPDLKINLSKARLLLVYDNPRALDVLSSALKGLGVRNLKRCGSLEDAKKFLSRQPIDLVIADCDLQEFDVLDLVHWLRRSGLEDNAFTPVMMVTSHTQIGRVKKARDCGANFIVAKPLLPATLLERIIWVAQDPRSFVEVGSYVGPDRRHKMLPPPETAGERRGAQFAQKAA
jgi:DNA-binding response OmpR family regulator